MKDGAVVALLAAISSAVAGTPDPRIVGADVACNAVGAVPVQLRRDYALDPFYVKHVDAGGLPVLSSAAPDDEALLRACRLAVNMLSVRPDVRDKLAELKVRFVVIGWDEGAAEIPEYGLRAAPEAEREAFSARARGIGGQASSCGEENLMCLKGDRYPNESICVHEFSHTIATGAYELDNAFGDRLQAAFDEAGARGALAGTYRAENPSEYLAEGVQDWYGSNASANPPDGIHNSVHTREQLKAFDPRLHEMIGLIFPADTNWGDCHAR